MSSPTPGRPTRDDVRAQVREFLTTRRAKVTPESAGLPVIGANRRVKGLRREEVAMLAGISVEYYTRLERGTVAGVSEGVLEGLANALRLDAAERAHLHDLLRLLGGSRPPRRTAPKPRIRASVQRILDSMVGAPAFVLNGRLDILATNQLGHALYEPMYVDPVRPANHARFMFLNPQAREFWPHWNQLANDTANLLRAEAGRDPFNPELTNLIGELSTRSAEFRSMWAKHDVRIHSTGVKTIHHPVVGHMELPYESTPLSLDTSQNLLIYTAEPGSPSQEALNLLASWAADNTELARRRHDTTRSSDLSAAGQPRKPENR